VDGWTAGADGGRELLVRSGGWEPVVRRVPAVHGRGADAAGVKLRLDREAFLRLPLFLPDPELEEAVYRAMAASEALRYIVTRFVRIEARNAVVRARGNLASESHRSAVVGRIRTTPGVLRLDDELATDERIVVAISLAMVPHRALQPSRVHVRSFYGLVTLEGDLDAARDVELAAGLAAAVWGVVEVRNRLHAREPEPPPEPPPPPPRGVVLIEPTVCR
jgi:hypothetical protein